MFNFPWTNFHELNLDWILSVVKEAKEVFDNGRSDIDYAVSTADEAKEIATQAAEATIPDNSISTIKLQNGAVTNAKLANNSVTTANIVDRTIIGNDIAENTIESYNIKNGTITGADIGNNTIDTGNLANGCVKNAQIYDNAVTLAKLSSELQTLMTKLNNLGTKSRAAWIATDNPSVDTKLTDTLVLPKAGIWLIVGASPVISSNITVGFAKSNKVVFDHVTYFTLNTYTPFVTVIETTADAQSIYLESASAQATTFSNVERGGLTAIKVQ